MEQKLVRQTINKVHGKCIIVELLLSAREYEGRTSSNGRGKGFLAPIHTTVEVNVNCAR